MKQQTTQYDVVLVSDKFKAFAQMCPEMSLADEVCTGKGAVIAGPEVLLRSTDGDEVKSQLPSFAERSVREGKHLAIIVRDIFSAGEATGTRGQLIFLNTEKILAGNF